MPYRTGRTLPIAALPRHDSEPGDAQRSGRVHDHTEPPELGGVGHDGDAGARDGKQLAAWPRSRVSRSGQPGPDEGCERDAKGDRPRDQHLPRVLALLYRFGTFVSRLSRTFRPSTMARRSGPEAWMIRPHMRLSGGLAPPSAVPNGMLRQAKLPSA